MHKVTKARYEELIKEAINKCQLVEIDLSKKTKTKKALKKWHLVVNKLIKRIQCLLEGQRRRNVKNLNKIVKLLANLNKLLEIKSNVAFVLRSCKVTYHKNICEELLADLNNSLDIELNNAFILNEYEEDISDDNKYKKLLRFK
ncbi:23796_t:CDS:2 [Cetraspora pellucida]|uniref:23796_t:CDS:1 n=1 Tax=Cetraspora pellucida TaxID=1433469 RepID=A0A9N9DY34_9GLOM|nr:23796_t:CDS:2 [Cetraspora pellucida]